VRKEETEGEVGERRTWARTLAAQDQLGLSSKSEPGALVHPLESCFKPGRHRKAMESRLFLNASSHRLKRTIRYTELPAQSHRIVAPVAAGHQLPNEGVVGRVDIDKKHAH
jgi:hypothetical protein